MNYLKLILAQSWKTCTLLTGCPHLSYLLFFNKATWIFLIVTLLAMPPFGKIRGIEVLSNVML